MMLKVLPYLTFRYEYVVTDSDRVIFKLYISYIFYLKMTDFGFQTNMLKALSFNFVRPRLFYCDIFRYSIINTNTKNERRWGEV